MFRWLVAREIAFLLRGSIGLQGPVFFVAVIAIFPLGIAPDPGLLQQIFPAITVIAMMLSVLLSLPMMWENDERDGTLDQWRLLRPGMEWVALAKCLSGFLVHALLLLPATCALGLMFLEEGSDMPTLLGSMALCLSAVVALGMLGSALTLGCGPGGHLLPILLLPLYIPVLIFAAHATSSPEAIFLLAAATLVSVPLSCWLTAWVLRQDR